MDWIGSFWGTRREWPSLCIFESHWPNVYNYSQFYYALFIAFCRRNITPQGYLREEKSSLQCFVSFLRSLRWSVPIVDAICNFSHLRNLYTIQSNTYHKKRIVLSFERELCDKKVTWKSRCFYVYRITAHIWAFHYTHQCVGIVVLPHITGFVLIAALCCSCECYVFPS